MTQAFIEQKFALDTRDEKQFWVIARDRKNIRTQCVNLLYVHVAVHVAEKANLRLNLI